jgi:hypothetical protein
LNIILGEQQQIHGTSRNSESGGSDGQLSQASAIIAWIPLNKWYLSNQVAVAKSRRLPERRG